MEFIRVLSPLLHKRLLIKVCSSVITCGGCRTACIQPHPLPYPSLILQGSRVLFILYALVWCILGITSSFMEENQWVSTLVFEILEGANYLLVLYLFRSVQASRPCNAQLVPHANPLNIPPWPPAPHPCFRRLRDFTAFIPRRPPSADEHPGQPKYWLVLVCGPSILAHLLLWRRGLHSSITP